MLPCTVPLANGGSVILLRFEKNEAGYAVKILDPLDTEGKQNVIQIDEFEKLWKNTVILVNVIRGKESKERFFDITWFLPELWKNRFVLICAVLLSFILNVLAFTPIIFIQIALDKVVGYKAISTLYVLTFGVFIALLFNAGMGFIREYIFNYVGDKIEARISGDIFDKLLGLPLQSVQGENIGRFERSIQSVNSLRNNIVTRIFRGIFDLTAVLVYLPILFVYNILMGLIVLGFAIFMGLSRIIFKSIEKKTGEDLSQIESNRNKILRETLSGMTIVKALGEEEAQRKKWRENSAASIRVKGKKNKITSTSNEFNGLLQQLMTVTVIFTGIQLVFSGDMSAGSIIAINMVGGRLVAPVIAAITMISVRSQIYGMITQLGEIWNKDPERLGAGTHSNIHGKYSLSNVSINFGEIKALNGVTIDMAPNSKIAVVRPSGAGKSTLLNLFAGVFPPTEGTLDIDGIRITQLDLSHYRSQVMLLTNNPIFFSGTIEDNLFRVSPRVGHRELEEIFKISGFSEHLNKLPDGIRTEIDGTATALTSTTAHLLALARALLVDPRVLLMDEFTDSLDIASRLKLEDNLKAISNDRTLINVSHELNSISSYDKIIVLNEGRVVGYDRHEQLLLNCETYQQMWENERKLFKIESKL